MLRRSMDEIPNGDVGLHLLEDQLKASLFWWRQRIRKWKVEWGPLPLVAWWVALQVEQVLLLWQWVWLPKL